MAIQLQLMWITLTTLAALVLVIATRPAGQVVDAEFARNLVQFAGSLNNTSIASLNQLRASLAADMVFLVAYGLLLRQSLLFAQKQRWTGLAQHTAVAAMVADATENVSALNILRRLEQSPAGVMADVPVWIFNVMNTASVAKWTLVGLVLLFLAWRWWPLIPGFKTGALRRVAAVTMIAFALGGLSSIAVAGTFFAGPGPLRKTSSELVFLGLGLGALLQFRLLDLIGVALRLLYLARVPMLVLLIAAGFGPIALGSAAPLLGGILDVPNATGIAVVTVAATVLAFACVTQINLVRAYGAQRTLDSTLVVLQNSTLDAAITWTAVVAVSSLLFCIGLSSLRITLGVELAGFAAGLVAGAAFHFVLEWVALLMSNRAAKGTAPHLGITFASVPVLATWLQRAYWAQPPALLAAVKAQVGRWSIAGRLFGLASGYLDSTRHLLPGHTFALVQLILSLIVYVALIFGKSMGAGSPESSLVIPTVASIVLLLLLNSWGLSLLTFFFDRYRIPLITVLIVLTAATGSAAWTDYVVEKEQEKAQYQLATPGDVLQRFPRPLIVTAAGGGIQAGAWAARVLDGLNEQLKQQPVPLRDRLALVSGVSGGSMGILYYGAYRDTTPPPNARCLTATCQSKESSLDEIASALVGTDHLRRVLSWPARPDRGAALEYSWASRLPSGGKYSIRDWSDRTRAFAMRESDAGPFPAFLFNTTVVETGQPAAFVTTQFPSRDYRDRFSKALKQSAVVESINRLFELSTEDRPESARDVGLQLSTAARLSATFPYVSPAATLDIDGSKPYHLVDGGYYDNYGLAAVSQWLDDALEQLKPTPQQPLDVAVAIVQGLMQSSEDVLKGDEKAKRKVKEPVIENHGWAWQLVAPPAAFLKTRSFGQWAGGMQTLQLLKEKWALRNVTIRPILLDYPAAKLAAACRAAPLSWKLSQPQQQCIEDGWEAVVADGAALSEIVR
jgi:hypothetical protein